MNANTLLQHFDEISEAPDAVPRLRRFILDLAVRGSLGTNDPNETVPKIYQRETQFQDLAANWRKLSFKEHFDIQGGNQPPKSHFVDEPRKGYVRLFQIRDLGNKPVPTYIPEESTKRFCREGEILVGRYGASVGKVFWAKDGAYNVALAKFLFPGDGLSAPFVFLLLKSDFFQDALKGASRSAQAGFNKRDLAVVCLPLPPLPEQHRIVAKVDELMALCDELEAAQTTREKRRDRLVAATLHRLNNGDTEPESEATFKQTANFYFNHLPRLTTKPEHIQQLRQTILNLAVRGKLVEQDPGDEPAAKVLGAGADLPEGYVRRRKILKKARPPLPVEELPKIPRSWEYAEIQSLYDLNIVIDYADGNHGSLYPRKDEFGDEGVWFVTAKDLADGRIRWNGCAKLAESRAAQLKKGWATGDDVLLTHNATVGRVARVEPSVGPFLLGTSVTFYRLNQTILHPGFFEYMLMSDLWQGQLVAIMEQTTRNQVSIQKQAFFRVAVPPLAEQRRIAAKVDELSALCDELESQRTATAATRGQALDAVLQEGLKNAQAS